MPRWAAVSLIGLTLATGLIVALVQVQAQESSRRGAWQTPMPSATLTPNTTQPAETNPADNGARSATNVVRPGGSLTDRLRAIRAESTDTNPSPAASGAIPAYPSTGASPVQPDDSSVRSTSPVMEARPTPDFGGSAPPTQSPYAQRPSTASDAPTSRFQFPARPQATTNSQATQRGTFTPTAAPPAAGHVETRSGDDDDGDLQSVLKRPSSQGFAPVNRMNRFTQGPNPTPANSTPTTDTPRVASEPQDASQSSSRRGATAHDLSPSPTAVRDWQSTSPTATPAHSAENLALTSMGPALRVETIGPASVALGQEAVYTVKVISLSDAAAENVLVSVDIPAWVQIVGGDTSTGRSEQEGGHGTTGKLLWHAGRIAAHSTEQLQLKLVPRTSQAFQLSVTWGFSPTPTVAQVEVQEPRLQVSLLGPDDMAFGQSTIYTIVLSNPGTGAAEHVSVELAPLVPGGEGGGMQQIGTLAAGERKEIQIEVTPRQAGALNLQVSAAADGDLHSDTAKQVRVRRAELQIAASGPELKYAGTVATYQLSVVNTGDAEAQDVEVDLALPAGARYVGGVDQAETTARGLQWTVGRLPAGAQRIYSVECEMTAAGNVSFEASSRAAGGLSSSAVVATRVESIADVTLTVADPQGPRPVGGDAVYEIHIVNRGTKEARGVTAVMQFSQGIEPVSADGLQAEIVPGQVLFAKIDRLDPGQEKTLKVVARADQAGTHVFRAEVQCPDPETRRVSEGTTRFFESSNASRSNSFGGGQFR